MNDSGLLVIALAVVGVLMAFVTHLDRKIALRWWHRRHDGRERPTTRIMMALIPVGFWLAAAIIWWLGRKR